MNEINGTNGKSFVTILLWIGSSIVINTTITIWLLNVHGSGRHESSLDRNLFTEYRGAAQLRYDYISSQFLEKSARFEKLFDQVDNRLDTIEKELYTYESWGIKKQNPISAE